MRAISPAKREFQQSNVKSILNFRALKNAFQSRKNSDSYHVDEYKEQMKIYLQ